LIYYELYKSILPPDEIKKQKRESNKEYHEIYDEWEQEQPNSYEEWNTDECQCIELLDTVACSVFGLRKCPLCRTRYERV